MLCSLFWWTLINFFNFSLSCIKTWYPNHKALTIYDKEKRKQNNTFKSAESHGLSFNQTQGSDSVLNVNTECVAPDLWSLVTCFLNVMAKQKSKSESVPLFEILPQHFSFICGWLCFVYMWVFNSLLLLIFLICLSMRGLCVLS